MWSDRATKIKKMKIKDLRFASKKFSKSAHLHVIFALGVWLVFKACFVTILQSFVGKNFTFSNYVCWLGHAGNKRLQKYRSVQTIFSTPSFSAPWNPRVSVKNHAEKLNFQRLSLFFCAIMKKKTEKYHQQERVTENVTPACTHSNDLTFQQVCWKNLFFWVVMAGCFPYFLFKSCHS